jgi:hypothetical protein
LKAQLEEGKRMEEVMHNQMIKKEKECTRFERSYSQYLQQHMIMTNPQAKRKISKSKKRLKMKRMSELMKRIKRKMMNPRMKRDINPHQSDHFSNPLGLETPSKYEC